DGSSWVQEHAEDVPSIPLEEVAFGDDARLEPTLGLMHRGLDLERGPLVGAAVLRVGNGPARLALVAHHLVVDAVSWGILLEDLFTAYEQIARGDAPALPPKTTSFQHWSQRLAAWAETPDARAEIDAWLATADREASHEIPLQDAGVPDTVGDASTIAAWLEVPETE